MPPHFLLQLRRSGSAALLLFTAFGRATAVIV
jgi:hypothetical protein